MAWMPGPICWNNNSIQSSRIALDWIKRTHYTFLAYFGVDWTEKNAQYLYMPYLEIESVSPHLSFDV